MKNITEQNIFIDLGSSSQLIRYVIAFKTNFEHKWIKPNYVTTGAYDWLDRIILCYSSTRRHLGPTNHHSAIARLSGTISVLDQIIDSCF